MVGFLVSVTSVHNHAITILDAYAGALPVNTVIKPASSEINPEPCAK